MRHGYFVCLIQLFFATFLLSQPHPFRPVDQAARVASPISASEPRPEAQAHILNSYGKLPLSFEANHGQTDGRVKFLSHTSGYSVFLTNDEAVLALSGRKVKGNLSQRPKPVFCVACSATAGRVPLPETATAAVPKAGGVLRMKLRNSNPAAKIAGMDELGGTSNFFIGNDPVKWQTNVPNYAKVKYEGIYSGIDLVYYGNQRQLEYDFIVAPGADPRRIAFDISGAKDIWLDHQGELVFEVGDGEIHWHKPVVYQERDGERQEIAASYSINAAKRVTFGLAKYDTNRRLYIDPLIYSTYLGGSESDGANGIAVDSAGNAYIVGTTTSTDFPTENPLQSANNSGATFPANAFVTKINVGGSALVYSTYLGGSGSDFAAAIAVDSGGNAYLTGTTTSIDFPITRGTLQTTCGSPGACDNGFVAKINPAGSALVYSTYLGGSGGGPVALGIATDSAGNAYVTGWTSSADFPATPGAFQTTCAADYYGACETAFVSKINPAGSAFVYSTYLGGSGVLTYAGDFGYGIAVDNEGNAYVTGLTYSNDFPTENPLQPEKGGGVNSGNAFVSKFNPAGSALIYSTYLGGSGIDGGQGIAVDGAGNVYLTGFAQSSDFPTKNPLQSTLKGYQDAFVSKFNSSGSALVYSTYFGGSSYLNFSTGVTGASGIAVDSVGDAYITGGTNSTPPNFAVKNAFQWWWNGGSQDAFVSKFNSSGSALVYSTYFGGNNYTSGNGIAVDRAGNAYFAGSTESTNLPTMNALQPSYGGNGDAFVAKINDERMVRTATAISSSPNPSTYGQAVTVTAEVTYRGNSLGANGEIVTFVEGNTVLGRGQLNDGTASFTTTTLRVGNNSVRAVYTGDSSCASSTSNVVKQVVNKSGE